MGMGYVLGIQPLPQLRAGGRGYLSETVSKTFVQSLITRDRSRRGIILTAKSKEKPDHILRFAILPLVHVDRDPKFDGFLSINSMNRGVKNLGLPGELTGLSREVYRRHLNLCSAS